MKFDVIMLSNSNFAKYGNNVASLHAKFRDRVGIRPDLIRTMINNSHKIWFAVDRSGVPIGILFLGIYDLPTSSSIDLVYVDPSKRHRGAGDALIRRAISYSNIKKVSFVELFRDCESKFLEDLYTKYGFCNHKHSEITTRMVKSFHRTSISKGGTK